MPASAAPGFDALYGLTVTGSEDGLVRGELTVRDDLRQPGGALHGGIYAAAADSLSMAGTRAAAAAPRQRIAVLANHLSLLDSIGEGRVLLTARARHRGRTTWVWEVECADGSGRVCAVARVTVALRS